MRIIIYVNKSSPTAVEYSKQAITYLVGKGIECLQDCDTCQDVDYIITFGGDGTILSAVRKYYGCQIPIMGFNVGKLGFMAEFSTNNIEARLDDLLAGNYGLTNRTTLKVIHKDKVWYCLNDAVIKNPVKMLTIKAFSNAQHIGDYRADGLIISTPTGSSAYSLACGGPFILPDANVICITPVAPHSLTLRPLVIPDTKGITLDVYSQKGENALLVDGKNVCSINNGESVKISLAEHQARIVVPLNSSYFDVLQKKLLWAEYAIT